jgi:hypothetical protein
MNDCCICSKPFEAIIFFIDFNLINLMPPKSKAAAAAAANHSGNELSEYERQAEDDDTTYRLKRDRNNIAVKKSREKSRLRARETAEKMARLRRENEELEQRTVELARELRTLKDVLLARASGNATRRTTPVEPKQVNATDANTGDSSAVALADPHTVSIDHEYTVTRVATK